jgi:GTP cyclohydrolase I
MTHHPILDSADRTAALPARSSANGTRPKSTLPASRGPARVDLDAAERPAADLNGGQRVVDLDAAERPVDLEPAERAAADFLTALRIDLDREERQATPARMALAYAELLAARSFRLTTFPNDEGYDELVLTRAIPFRTLCEHHMLLFSGVAHVGYLPGERILGLSKLARLVEHFAARPQTQERLTMQIAKCLDANLGPRGRRRGARGCAHLHDPARHPRPRHHHRYLGRAGHVAHRPRSRAELFALARVPTSASM